MNALQKPVVFKATITVPTFQALTNALALMVLLQTRETGSVLVCNRVKLIDHADMYKVIVLFTFFPRINS